MTINANIAIIGIISSKIMLKQDSIIYEIGYTIHREAWEPLSHVSFSLLLPAFSAPSPAFFLSDLLSRLSSQGSHTNTYIILSYNMI
jgi:hypothetical protein